MERTPVPRLTEEEQRLAEGAQTEANATRTTLFVPLRSGANLLVSPTPESTEKFPDDPAILTSDAPTTPPLN